MKICGDGGEGGCGKMCYYAKARTRDSPGLCSDCHSRSKEHKPINKVSDSKKIDDRAYKTLNKVFLDSHKVCEAGLPGCQHWSKEVHHLYSGGSRSKYYLSVLTWKAVCAMCHFKIHNVLSKDEAISLDLKRIE